MRNGMDFYGIGAYGNAGGSCSGSAPSFVAGPDGVIPRDAMNGVFTGSSSTIGLKTGHPGAVLRQKRRIALQDFRQDAGQARCQSAISDNRLVP